MLIATCLCAMNVLILNVYFTTEGEIVVSAVPL